MKLLATHGPARRPRRHRTAVRLFSPLEFCQPLEPRTLLSFAPSSLVGDSIIVFATSGTSGSAPPNASLITFAGNGILSETDLINGDTTAGTYTYAPVGNTALLVVTESGNIVNVTVNFNSAQSGTYATATLDILHPGSQHGIFVLYDAASQLAAPPSLAGEQINLNFAGGAGTGVVTSGALSAQFYSNNTFNALQTPVSGGPSLFNGTFTYTPTFASRPGAALVQVIEGGNAPRYLLLAFTSAGGGAVYLTDANGGNNSLNDYSFGDFFVAPFTQTTTLTTLGTSLIPAPEGANVTLTASVLPNVAGSHTPTGTVTFKEGAMTLGAGSVNSSGQASFSSTSLTVGIHPITAVFSGDANFAGSTTAAPFNQVIIYNHATNVAYVTQVYNDLLHRDPDGSGLDYWTHLLDTAGATLVDVATALTSSREYDGDVVDSFYVQYLGRHSELAGLNIWVDQMQGGLNAEVIRAGILASLEYYNRVGGTDSAYITVLYTNFLHRDPDGPGLAVWIGQLDHSSPDAATNARIAVSSSISNSTESRTDIATGFYETFLHRGPDDAGLQVWITNLANGVTQPQIISFFVTTAEYLNLHNIT